MKQPDYKCSEKLWKTIVRPPKHNYRLKDMRNEIFMIKDTIVKRLDFEMTNSRGLTLQCSLFESVKIQDQPHMCMIYLHRNSRSSLESLTILEYLLPQRIAVCGIDLSGSGQSQGKYISLGFYELRDVNDLYNYLRSNKPFITQIGLWGRSMGSVTAILAASLNSNSKILVCDSPFSNLTHLYQEKEAKFNTDDINLVQVIQTLSTDVAIVFLSAKGDTLIGEKHPKILFEKFRGIKEFFQFEGTHNSNRLIKFMKSTVQFINTQMEKQEQHNSLRDTKVQLNCKDQIPITDVGAPLLHLDKPYISKTEK